MSPEKSLYLDEYCSDLLVPPEYADLNARLDLPPHSRVLEESFQRWGRDELVRRLDILDDEAAYLLCSNAFLRNVDFFLEHLDEVKGWWGEFLRVRMIWARI